MQIVGIEELKELIKEYESLGIPVDDLKAKLRSLQKQKRKDKKRRVE